MVILLGFLVIAFGVLITAKSEWLLNNFGRIGFFEEHLGMSGGSRLGYKLLGMAVIFIGILMATNMIGGFIMWVLTPIIRQMAW